VNAGAAATRDDEIFNMSAVTRNGEITSGKRVIRKRDVVRHA